MKTEYSQQEIKLIEENKTSIQKVITHLPNISLPDFIQKVTVHYANEQVEKFNKLFDNG